MCVHVHITNIYNMYVYKTMCQNLFLLLWPIANYPQTLWLKTIIPCILLTIWAEVCRDSLFLLKLASAGMIQRLGTRITCRLALMSAIWCWLWAKTLTGAVDRNTLLNIATGFQGEPPTHTYTHMKRDGENWLFQVEEMASTSVSWDGIILCVQEAEEELWDWGS